MKTLSRFSLILTLLVSSLCITPNAWAEGEDLDYLTITPIDGAMKVGAYKVSVTTNVNVEYRIINSSDGNVVQDWTVVPSAASTKDNPSYKNINLGQKMQLRGKDANKTSGLSTSTTNYYRLSILQVSSGVGSAVISGNVMSLVDNTLTNTTTIPCTYCFNQLFWGASFISSIDDLILPATNLTDYCYQQMFESCSRLTSANCNLPATDVPQSAYLKMFNKCTALTTPPTIAATSIGNYGCQYMFAECTSLETAPALPATSIGNNAYNYMFQKCSLLVTVPELAITSVGNSGCASMFSSCVNLKNVPDLEAETIDKYTYSYMFSGCSSLQKAPNIAATTMNDYACQYMFQNCTELTKAPDALYPTSVPLYAYQYMFDGCSKLTKSPEIYAQTPRKTKSGTGSSNAYKNCAYMFQNCSKLDTIIVHFEEWCSDNGGTYGETYNWLSGIKASGKFYIPFRMVTNKGWSEILKNRASNHYIANKWNTRIFFDYTYNTNGGYWDAGMTENKNIIGQSYLNIPEDMATSAASVLASVISDTIIASAPSVVYKSGYKFYGWNTHSDATSSTEDGWAPKNKQEIIYDDVTYYAIYELAASGVKLTFNPNGGTWTDDSSPDSKVFDSPLASVPAITKTGYHLVGWQDNDGKDFEPQEPYGEDITFTAIWLPIYTFIPTGGAWEDTGTSDTRTFYGEFSLPTLTKIGCYNLTWSPALPVAPATWPDTSTTYTASWSEYQFTFHAQAGTWTEGGGSADKTYGAAVGNRPTTLPAITRDGYLFRGWNTASDASGDWLADAAGLPDFANGDYYAIWSEIFTFYPNNGTWTNGSQDASRVLYKYNISADDIAISRSQYVFDGWDPAFDIDNMPSASGSFTAQWLPELTFNPNGGKWSDESTTAKVITTAVGETPTRNGYAFTEWDNSYNPASLPTTPTTFTAQWNAYTYTFDVATNGGTWDGSDDANKDFTEETLASLTNPQRTNHVFLGWNTAGDGSGNNFNIDHLPTANTTFYAQFSEVHFFSIKALTGNVTIGTKLVNSPSNLPTLSYSIDGGSTWTNLTLGTSGTEIVLASTGDSVLFRGTNERLNPNSSHIKGSSLNASPEGSYWTFTATNQVSVTGNLMTLIQDVHPTNTLPTGDNCVFGPLFAGMPVVDASRLELPTVTSYSCYQYMFYNCTSLTQAPVLPATYAERSAYCGMFSGCTNLTTAPTIYATDNGTTDEKNGAFAYMFYNCSTLNNISVKFDTWTANATNTWVKNVASSGTFTCPSALLKTMSNSNIPSNWTVQFIPELTFNLNGAGHWDDLSTDNLIVEPETPLTTLPVAIADAANRVFYGWNTSANGSGAWLTLENQPVISTTAQRITYYAIYAPNPAVNITFSLSNYPDASWDGSDKTDKVISTADLLTSGRPVPQLGDQYFGGWITSPTGTTNELDLANLPTEATTYYPIFHNYLCIKALHDNVQIGTWHYVGIVPFQLEYSTDGINWTTARTNDQSVFVTLANKGDKVYLKGNNPRGINSKENGADFQSTKYVKFTISDSASVSGNIMTLINAEEPPLTIPSAYSLAKLFTHINTSGQYAHIIHVSDLQLPATTLKQSCYESLFENCAKLIDAPQLGDITTIPDYAFKSMFKGCSSLTIAPEFTSVTEVGNGSCNGMFYGCTSLVNAPALMATTLAKDCYQGMFYNCSALRHMNVAFTSWGNNNNYYTSNWMYGTTTDINDNAEFGCAGLPILRGTSNIQENWKVVIPDIVVNADAYSSEIINGANIFLTNGATLTLNNNFTPVKMSVAAGCKLTIPESYTLTVDSIILQGGDTTNGTYRYLTPEIVVNGHIQTSTGTATPILYDYLLNDVQYYTLALPYDVTINDITYPDGTPAVIGIQDYDGAARVQGKDQGAWRTIYTNDPDVTKIEDATTLSAGRGYTIYAVPETDKTYSRVRFPMHPDFSAAPEAQKSVAVYGYGCTDGKPTTEGNENNVGWNLIGNPYLATFGNSWVTLRMNEAEVVDYVIIPANDGRSYHPELMINASLPAFKNFFVQVFENGTLSFDIHTRAQQSPSRAPMTSTRIFAGITLSGNGQEDKMGLTLRDDYTEGYDPYADLSKWMNQGLNIYASVGGNNLTMAAVSADRAQSAIPLVVKTAVAGTLTFTLNHAWDMNIDKLEHLYLEDTETQTLTDLLSDSYVYEATKGTTEGRFFLTAVRRNTPTSNEQLQPATATDVVKFIRDGHLLILRNNRFYNAQGQIIR